MQVGRGVEIIEKLDKEALSANILSSEERPLRDLERIP